MFNQNLVSALPSSNIDYLFDYNTGDLYNTGVSPMVYMTLWDPMIRANDAFLEVRNRYNVSTWEYILDLQGGGILPALAWAVFSRAGMNREFDIFIEIPWTKVQGWNTALYDAAKARIEANGGTLGS